MSRRSHLQRIHPAFLILSTLFALPLFYVLSIGPMAVIFNRTGLAYMEMVDGVYGTDIFNFVYAPLGWVYHHTPLRKPLEMYVRFWDDEKG